MEKVYMVCDAHDAMAAKCGAWETNVENMGSCRGRILREDGTEIGRHSSGSFGWLRLDLQSKLEDPSKYEIVDLIGQEVPDRFRMSAAPEAGAGAGAGVPVGARDRIPTEGFSAATPLDNSNPPIRPHAAKAAPALVEEREEGPRRNTPMEVLQSIASIRLDGEPDDEGQDSEMDIDDAFRLLSDAVEGARSAISAPDPRKRIEEMEASLSAIAAGTLTERGMIEVARAALSKLEGRKG